MVLRVLRSLSLKLLQVSLLKAEQVKRQEKERVRGWSNFPSTLHHLPTPMPPPLFFKGIHWFPFYYSVYFMYFILNT